jgi:SAM-dependent methyltransferase
MENAIDKDMKELQKFAEKNNWWLTARTEWLIGVMAGRYNRAFPNYPPLAHTDRWFYGVWMIGNDYKNKSEFYGAYPNGLLKRYKALFGGNITSYAPYNAPRTILHLFSGSLPKSDDYIRFDMIQEADIQGDAEKLSEYFEPNSIDLIYADPPYSGEDADKYGTPMVNRNKVVKECAKVLKPGGLLVWLDCVYPMYSKKDLQLIGTVGLIRSTNHRFRVICVYRKEQS